MPVDPNIALSVQTPQMPNVSQSLMQGQQMALQRQQMLSLQAERQAQTADIQAKADAARQLAQNNATVDGLMKTAFTPDSDTGTMLFNRNVFQQGLVQAGLGHLYPQLSDSLDKMENSAIQTNLNKRKMIANTMFGITQAGNDPGALQMGLAFLKANQALSPDHEQAIQTQLAQAPTSDTVGGIIKHYGGYLPEYQDLANKYAADQAALAKTKAETAASLATALEKTTTAGQTQRQQDIENLSAAPTAQAYASAYAQLPPDRQAAFPPPQAWTPKTAATLRTMGMTPAELAQNAVARGNLAVAQGELGIKQKTFEATLGAGLDVNGQPLSPDAIKQAALADPQVMMMASNRMAPPSPRIAYDPKYKFLFQKLQAVNPDYDATKFPERQKVANALSAAGPLGQQVTAMNTAVQHLDMLSQAAQALGNGTFTPQNALYNKVATMFGGTAPTNFQTINELVDGEVGAVVKKGAATEGEMKRQAATSSASSSPAQITGRINTLIPLMASKINSIKYQAGRDLGDNDPMVKGLIMPEVQGILQSRGFNADGTQKASGTVKMSSPDGSQTMDVPAEQVDHYKSLGAKVVGG